MGLTKPRAAQIFNLDYKQSTRVVTTTNITLAGGAPSSVDGVSLSAGDRVLVTGQSTGSQNGLYYITTLGSGSSGTWARTSDGNENGEIEAGMIVMVTEGAIYADTQWKLITDDPITIGTTALSYTQNYSANSIAGGTSNVRVFSNANVVISSAGTANVLTVTSTGTVTTGTASVTGNITGGNITIPGSANISTFIGNTFFGTVPAQPTYYNIAPININNSLSSATKVQLNLINTGGGAGAGSAIDFYTYQISVAAANAEARIAGIDDGNYSAYLSLQTKTPGATGTNGLVERVKVDSTGVSVVANITGGNIRTGGLVSATGGVTAASVAGGVITGSSASVTGTVTAASTVGGVITGSSASLSGNVTGGNVLTGGLISATGNITGANLTVSGNIMPTANNVYTLGSPTMVFQHLYVGPNSMFIGGAPLSTIDNGDSLLFNGEPIVTANTAGTSTTYGNMVIVGNITGSNILTSGLLSTTSNITGSYLLANIAFATGYTASKIYNGTSEANIGASGGNANISVGGTSNVVVFASTGEYVSGLLSVTGNITGGNISATNHTGTNVSITGTVTAASIVGGIITGTSTSVTGTQTAASTVGGVITGSSASVAGGVTAASVSGGVITGTSTSVTGTQTAASTVGGVITGLSLSASGNVTGGNVLTGGLISTTGNITSGNISATNHTGTNVSITGTVTAASTVGGVITASSASVSGTVTAASTVGGIITGSSASVTGNVTGSNIVATTAITNGNITITGANIVSTGPTIYIDPNGSGGTDGNVIITGNLSVQGNVTYINSNNVTTNDLTINMANNAATAAAANGGGIGVGPAGSEYISLTYNSTSNIWVATNGLSSPGILSASGNVTGGNLTTSGQVSAAGNVIGSTLIASGNIAVQSRQQVKFYDTDSSNFISLRAPNALTGDYLLTLPTGYGNADQVLSTNGAGILAWADQTGGNGGGQATSYPNSTVSPVPGATGNFDLTFNFVQTSQEIPFESSATDAFGVNLGEVYSMMDPGGEVLEPVDLGVLT